MPTRAAGGSWRSTGSAITRSTANGSLCRAASRRQCGFPYLPRRLRLAMKRQLLRGGHQGLIDAGDRSILHPHEPRPQLRGPAPIDGVALAVTCRDDLAADDACPSVETWCQARGDTEADDGLAAVVRFAPGSGRLAARVAAARQPPSPRPIARRCAPRRASRVTAMTKPRCPARLAHIPTRTDVVLAAFRLR